MAALFCGFFSNAGSGVDPVIGTTSWGVVPQVTLGEISLPLIVT